MCTGALTAAHGPTMAGIAGLRMGELLALRWRDIDMTGGWMYVEESKAAAGRRRIKVRGALQAELVRVRERQTEAEPEQSCSPRPRAGSRAPTTSALGCSDLLWPRPIGL
jgi:integrase